ncbi:hypothetical protein [Shewanella ulleungensis]|jgi:hypothetical protein|uniref:Uncharacterized protein n=1 Tax=Shewanella ulleungensis TaxID=2282699 RepID=A0ABQ2QJR0_9GAMM|nr:hypothetical protein [Shewanella ulleungensis]MCL1152236.1 hypothetical protein [Shewanella ulleungensis]GGP81842.1 hypothetical protein GCM10009410_13490 [Shewanella ulleungensis]
MMKNWLKKIFGRPIAAKTNKVQIDMRYEVHSFKSDKTTEQPITATLEHNSPNSATPIQKPTK